MCLAIDGFRLDERQTYPLTAWDMYNDAPDRYLIIEIVPKVVPFSAALGSVFQPDYWIAVHRKCAQLMLSTPLLPHENCRYVFEQLYYGGSPPARYRLREKRFAVEVARDTGRAVRSVLLSTRTLMEIDSQGDAP